MKAITTAAGLILPLAVSVAICGPALAKSKTSKAETSSKTSVVESKEKKTADKSDDKVSEKDETSSEVADEPGDEASETVDETAAAPVDEKKQKVIEELLEVTNISSRVELIRRAFWRSALMSFARAASKAVKDDPKFAKADREELVDEISARSKKMGVRYQELLKKEIDLDKEINAIAARVYAKHFTTEELQNIVDFYKTPTGIKARQVMPEVAKEALTTTQVVMEPRLKKVVEQVMLEEIPESSSNGKKKAEEPASSTKTEPSSEG